MTKKRIALGAVTAVSTFLIPIATAISCGKKQNKMGETTLMMDKTTNIKTNSFSRGILAGIQQEDKEGFATNVKEDTTASRADKIKELSARGVKNFVLGSFAMDPEEISKVLGDKTPNLISVDQDKSATKNKHIASISAKAQEGAFLGGYLVAQHMHSKEFKAKQPFQDGKLKFGYVSGYRFSAVTDFLYGIINGIKEYEKINKINKKDAIEIIGGNGHDKEFYAQAWNPNDTKYQAA